MRVVGVRAIADTEPRGALLALALVLGLAGAAAPAWGAPAETAVTEADAELARLRDFLAGAERTFATRRDAADVLIDKDSDAARAVLVEVLAAPTPSEATLAVLETIALRDSAHAAFVDPLFGLLRSDDAPTRQAAALAFSAYQGNDKVLDGLKSLVDAPATPEPVHLAAIQALAQLMDRRAIGALVQMTSDPRSAVAKAADAALAEMTGLAGPEEPGGTWAEWWKRHKDAPESQLLAGLLRRFRKQLTRRAAELERVQARLIAQLVETYEAADAKQKAKLVVAHLDDAVPQVRALGAKQAAALARAVLTGGNGASRQAHQEVIAAVLKRVADESPSVRAAAAEGLAAWQEATAGPVLLARLGKEKVPEARAAVAAALGSLKVVKAVPTLVAMLDSPHEVEVLRAAGALGQIGEKNGQHADAVKPALEPLGRLARTAVGPSVREAACLALAKMAPPSAEAILSLALEDPTPSVRFSAAQGLGNLGKASEKTVAALVARLQDKNAGVRQAVAAALAKVGGAEAAAKMADRLKVGAEAEPAVRNALWEALRSLADSSGSPDLGRELGDRFFALEGAEQMQRAAAMYELALAKVPATARNSPAAIAIYEKLVDAYLAAGTPDAAVPTLRQLLIITPPENKARLRELNEQLGLILLAKEPHADAVAPLAAAIDGADDAARAKIVKAIQARAEALLKADRPEPAMDLLGAFGRACPDWGGPGLADALKALHAQAVTGATTQAIAKLGGTDEQALAADATLKKIGQPAAAKLFDTLEAAAKQDQKALETRALVALEAITGRSDHGYAAQLPLADRLKKIAAWRGAS